MHNRRVLAAASLVSGIVLAVVAGIAYLTSGASADLARCAEPVDSLDTMSCGLTRMSVGAVILGAAALVAALVGAGAWLLASSPRSEGEPRVVDRA